MPFHCLYYTRIACKCQGFLGNFIRVACEQLSAHTVLCRVGAFLFLSFVVRSLSLPAAKKGTLGAKGGKLNVQV
nr:MAG TPA: hypothetical protein [Caudoviricetes sp.]